MSWLQKVKQGLSKTASAISSGINFGSNKKIDDALLQEIEDSLISADVGIRTTSHVINDIKQLKFKKDANSKEIIDIISSNIMSVFSNLDKKPEPINKPHVILLCGVNGNGKTTTAGKLAMQFAKNGKKVMLVACDTFRAAATDQLQIWAQRANAKFIYSDVQSDPASVAFKGLQEALIDNTDIVIIDTAGRLHNKQNLMDELVKITKVLTKLDLNAPHECILVLDATTGQNALTQVEVFAKNIKISSLIITKLDGTAKAGILINVTQKFGLPISAIGVGEGIEDLDKFDAKQYVDALLTRQ